MNQINIYQRYRFPSEIIQYTAWIYYRFNLSHRRCVGPFIEYLLAERGINVSYEAMRFTIRPSTLIIALISRTSQQGFENVACEDLNRLFRARAFVSWESVVA